VYYISRIMSALGVSRLYVGANTTAQTAQSSATVTLGPTGSDTNNTGTNSNFPLGTLQAAIAAIRATGYIELGTVSVQAGTIALTGELVIGVQIGGLGEQRSPLLIQGSRTTTTTRTVSSVAQNANNQLVTVGDTSNTYTASNVGQICSFESGSLAPLNVTNTSIAAPITKSTNVEAWITSVPTANTFAISYNVACVVGDAFKIYDVSTTFALTDEVTFHGNGNDVVFQNIVFTTNSTRSFPICSMTFVNCTPVFQSCKIIVDAGTSFSMNVDQGTIFAPGTTHYLPTPVGYSAGLYIDASLGTGCYINNTSGAKFDGRGIVITGAFNGWGGDTKLVNAVLSAVTTADLSTEQTGSKVKITNCSFTNNCMIRASYGAAYSLLNCTVDSSSMRVQRGATLSAEYIEVTNAIDHGIEVTESGTLHLTNSGITTSASDGLRISDNSSAYVNLSATGIVNSGGFNVDIMGGSKCRMTNTGTMILTNVSIGIGVVNVIESSSLDIETAILTASTAASGKNVFTVSGGSNVNIAATTSCTMSSIGTTAKTIDVSSSEVSLSGGTFTCTTGGILVNNGSKFTAGTLTVYSSTSQGIDVAGGSTLQVATLAISLTSKDSLRINDNSSAYVGVSDIGIISNSGYSVNIMGGSKCRLYKNGTNALILNNGSAYGAVNVIESSSLDIETEILTASTTIAGKNVFTISGGSNVNIAATTSCVLTATGTGKTIDVSSSEVSLSGGTFTCTTGGILVNNGSKFTAGTLTVNNSTGHGIEVAESSTLKVTTLAISASATDGLRISDNSNAFVGVAATGIINSGQYNVDIIGGSRCRMFRSGTAMILTNSSTFGVVNVIASSSLDIETEILTASTTIAGKNVFTISGGSNVNIAATTSCDLSTVGTGKSIDVSSSEVSLSGGGTFTCTTGGIRVYDGSKFTAGTLTVNTSTGHGIEVAESSTLKVTTLAVSASATDGLRISDNSSAFVGVAATGIINSGQYNVDIMGGSRCKMTSSADMYLNNSTGSAVNVIESSSLHIRARSIIATVLGSVFTVNTGSHANIYTTNDSVLSSTSTLLANLSSSAVLYLFGPTYTCAGAGIRVGDNSKMCVESLAYSVTGSSNYGLYVTGLSTFIATSDISIHAVSMVSASNDGLVYVTDNSTVSLINGDIHDSKWYGVYIANGSRCLLDNMDISTTVSPTSAVHCINDSSISLISVTGSNSGPNAIYLGSGATCSYTATTNISGSIGDVYLGAVGTLYWADIATGVYDQTSDYVDYSLSQHVQITLRI
jgi:hypothetical protein